MLFPFHRPLWRDSWVPCFFENFTEDGQRKDLGLFAFWTFWVSVEINGWNQGVLVGILDEENGRRCWHAKKIGPSLCNDVMFWTMVSWACNGKDFVLFSLGSFMEIRNIFLQHIYVSSWDNNVAKLHMCNMLICSCRLSLGWFGMLQILGVLANKIYFRMHEPRKLGFPEAPSSAMSAMCWGYQPCRRFTAGWRCENPMRPRGLMMLPFFLPAKNFPVINDGNHDRP